MKSVIIQPYFFYLWKYVDKGMLNNYNYGGQILLDS